MPAGQPPELPCQTGFSLSGMLKAKAASEARRYARDESGVTAVIFGLMFTMILFFVAMTVDTSRIVNEMTREQNAVDAAALAASTLLGTERTPEQEQALAETFLDRNMDRGVDGASHSNIGTLILDDANGEVTATARSNLPATLMAAFKDSEGNKYTNFAIDARSKVKKGNGKVEIALVLDNSGSMSGTKITQLKTAATNLINTVFNGAEGTDKVKVALVPFAGSVNVGPQHAGATWMDTSAESSVHKENFCSSPAAQCPQANRFTLFSQLGVAWKGCVEARPGTLDTTDAAAASGDTKFVPMFAPDEPDTINAGGKSYSNSYRIDDMGTCPAQTCSCSTSMVNGTCKKKSNGSTGWALTPIPPSSPHTGAGVAQARTCKYASNALPSDQCTTAGVRKPQSGTGPNYGCEVASITPLTETKQTVLDGITAMQAGGYTNIGEGTMWGWRALSPTEPFAEGRAYEDDKNSKFLVIMTDGVNTYNYSDNHNKSPYRSHGYADPFSATSPERLGTTYTDTNYKNILNQKLTTACTNAKDQGITVFTVAYDFNDPNTLALLTNCASSPQYAYLAADDALLAQAFNNIGKEIAALRVAE